jgi:peptide/nickel transport system permease protein
MQSDRTGDSVFDAGRIIRKKPPVLQSILRFAGDKPLGALGALVLLFLVFLAATADVISPFDPKDTTSQNFLEPNGTNLFGTDNLGRDILTLTIHGSRISLFVGFTSVLIGVTAALVLALVTGYFGGWSDSLTQRIGDTLMAFPGLILALFLVSVLEPSHRTVVVAVAIIFLAPSVRTIRSQVLAIKSTTYIEAARAVGCTPFRVIGLHIFPNILALYVVVASLNLGAAIIIEASLSFLGLGPASQSWGKMVSDGSRHLFLEGPWWSLFPSLALAITVYSFNMLGDALRDIWDPRLRGSR